MERGRVHLGLASCSASTSTPSLSAIPENVSPDFTVYDLAFLADFFFVVAVDADPPSVLVFDVVVFAPPSSFRSSWSTTV
jgi:hypothetical protein